MYSEMARAVAMVSAYPPRRSFCSDFLEASPNKNPSTRLTDSRRGECGVWMDGIKELGGRAFARSIAVALRSWQAFNLRHLSSDRSQHAAISTPSASFFRC